MYNWIARNVLARTLDYARGTRTLTCLNDLEMSQWWSKDKIQKVQYARLQALIQHAYENVPYYRHAFDEKSLKPEDIKCSTDLVKLPVLNKGIIKSNFNSLKANNFSQKNLIPASTSGSTGNPLKFCSTLEDRYNWGYARALRARSWSGNTLGDKVADFHPYWPEETATVKISKRPKRYFSKTIQIDPNKISNTTLPLIAQRLEAFNPKFFFGYPSAIYLIARYFQSRGMNIKLQAVLSGDEQLYDYQRELFKKVFKCDTYNIYSSWEVYDIAAECVQHNGCHIAAENVIVEIADTQGNPVPAGMEGRILVTNLHNYGMPFVRYDIGDWGAVSDDICACGREGLPLLINLHGRADDIFITRSGKQIPGRALPQRFLAQFGVAQYQIIQENYDEIIMQIVLDNQYKDQDKVVLIERIRANYEPIFGPEITLKVKFTEQIEPSKSGKRSVFLSKISSIGP